MAFVYKADPQRAAAWAAHFALHAPQLPFRVWPDVGDANEVRYLAAWLPPDELAATFPNLEVLFSVGAGVDQLNLAQLPPRVQLVRMIDPALTATMAEYVAFSVIALHRDMPLYLSQQRERVWRGHRVRPAGASRVGIMGMGMLGTAALVQLQALGFDAQGWKRGMDLDAFLARTEILVCLLPLTDSTRGILDRRVFGALPQGAALVQVGRGGHLVEADLLHALDTGHLRAAVLDVCETEPLPQEHRFWQHPRVWLTPHIASTTHPDSAVQVVLANIARHERGEAMHGLVDRSRGY
jgi:glyoxylate/hydroxypyruvate reductase